MKMNVLLLIAVCFIFGTTPSSAQDGRDRISKVVRLAAANGSFAKTDLRPLSKISAPEISAKDIVVETKDAIKDYMPLVEGRVLVYSLSGSENDADQRIEVRYYNVRHVNAEYTAADMEVKIIEGKKKAKVYTFAASSGRGSATGFNLVAGGTRKEFPLPSVKGDTWNSSFGIETIATMLGRINVPAGNYAGCLKITTKINGGESGNATRYYANGIGLVYEEVMAEESHSVLKLIEVK